MKKPNIILISIDTLRADHVSCYGHYRKTTPNLDQIAAHGIRFKNAFSTAVWTPPAHASMLTGLYPSQHGVIDQNKLSPEIPTLAELLNQHGYQTSGFVNNSQVGELVGLNRGHEDFYEVWRGLSRKEILKLGMNKARELLGQADHGAAETNRLIMQWFSQKRNSRKPFYLFAHYIDAHNPLKPPQPFLFKYLREELRNEIDMEKFWMVADNPLVCYTDDLKLDHLELEALSCLYDESINYVDHKIGELYRWLQAQGLLDNTLLIVTADHGEHLGEHGYYSHVASVYEPVVHIPLIVRYPEVLPEKIENDAIIQLTDIVPIALSAAQIDYHTEHLDAGKDLFEALCLKRKNLYAISEWEGRMPYFVQRRLAEKNGGADLRWFRQPLTMIRDERYKLIVGNDSSRLYDLANDPDEKHDVAQKKPEVAERLAGELHEWRNRNSEKQAEAEMYELDLATKRNLEGLGYL